MMAWVWRKSSGRRRLGELAALNMRLEAAAGLDGDEGWLSRRLAELDRNGLFGRKAWWLTLARLLELTVHRLGGLANQGDFKAVGDLMFNPRQVLIHVRGRSCPIVKDRYTPLTEQFRHQSPARFGVIQWLKKETIVQVRSQPLAMELWGRVTRSGRFSETWLAEVDRRMKTVSDVIALASSCRLDQGQDFQDYILTRPFPDQDFLRSRLCRFSLEHFDRMGRELQTMALQPDADSVFFQSDQAAPPNAETGAACQGGGI